MGDNRRIPTLNLAAEAERKRQADILSGVTEYNGIQSVMCRHQISRRVLNEMEAQYLGLLKLSDDELLSSHGITNSREFVFNDVLGEIANKLATELIKQGLMLVEIADSKYDINTCNLTVSAYVIKPPIDRKRLDIDIS